jgi:hypothetical protein
MSATKNQVFTFDPEAITAGLFKKLEGIESKLDTILSGNKDNNEIEVDWITAKKFMELLSIKSFNTLYKLLDKGMSFKKVSNKIYIHKDEIKKYFSGAYNE